MSVMEFYQNMLKSSEGVIYLAMMALAILPIAYAMIKYIKYSSLGLAFLFWTTIAHCLWYVGLLSLIYEQTPPGMPSNIYIIMALVWNAIVIGIIYLSTKKPTLHKFTVGRKVLNGVLGFLLAVVSFIIISFFTLILFLFGPTYHIKTGEMAWVSEKVIRKKVGSDVLPKFEYDRTLSNTIYLEDCVAQNHQSVFGTTTSSNLKKIIQKKSKLPHSGWKEISAGYSFDGKIKKNGEDYTLSLLLHENCDTIWISIYHMTN